MKFNKKSILILIFFILANVLLFSCSNNKIENSIAKDEYKVTSEEFNEDFLRDYGLTNLKKHEIYYDGKTIQAEYYFNSKVKDWEMDSTYLFSVNKFIYKKYSNISPRYYDNFLLDNLLDNEIEKLVFIVYSNGKLKRYEVYGSNGLLIDDFMK